MEVHIFHFEMYKTADFHSKLLISWDLVTELKCAHFTHFKLIETLTKYSNSLDQGTFDGTTLFWIFGTIPMGYKAKMDVLLAHLLACVQQ